MKFSCPDQVVLDKVFSPEKTDAFFEAIYGDVEEGAYDIHLTCKKVEETRAFFNFELRRRSGKCLKCSLTYGLPQVFQRHPLLDIAGVAKELAKNLGWNGAIKWQLSPVEEINDDLHVIPFEIVKE